MVLELTSLQTQCQLLLLLRVRLDVNDGSVVAFEDELALNIHLVSKIGLKKHEVLKVAHHDHLVPVFLVL